jgi:ABC-2 type transport system ATP-binding protein
MSDVVLRTRGLVRSFGRRTVLKGLDLEVPRGSVYGFLGRNGAGKTTLIRMLIGTLVPNAGEIEIDGHRVRRVTAPLRRSLGYVPQEQHFYEWMTGDTLGRFVGAFQRSWDHAWFRQVLERLGVEARQPARELSGGSRVKLALALALGHRPPLLVLDEPTTGVDPVTRRELLDLLRAEADAGRSVFFSTHYVAEIEAIGDRVGVLHGGKLVYEGPVAEMRGEAATLEDAFVAMARAAAT